MMQAIKALVFMTLLVIDIEIIQGLYLENGNQFRLGRRRPISGPQSSTDESDTFHSVMGKNRNYIFFQTMQSEIECI